MIDFFVRISIFYLDTASTSIIKLGAVGILSTKYTKYGSRGLP